MKKFMKMLVVLMLCLFKMVMTPFRWIFNLEVSIPVFAIGFTWAYHYYKNATEYFPFVMTRDGFWDGVLSVGKFAGNTGYAVSKGLYVGVGQFFNGVGNFVLGVFTFNGEKISDSFSAFSRSFGAFGVVGNLDSELTERVSHVNTIAGVREIIESPWKILVILGALYLSYLLLYGLTWLINRKGEKLLGKRKWLWVCPERFICKKWRRRKRTRSYKKFIVDKPCVFLGTLLLRYSVLMFITGWGIKQYHEIASRVSFGWSLFSGAVSVADLMLGFMCLPVKIAMKILGYSANQGLPDIVSIFSNRTIGSLTHVLNHIKPEDISNLMLISTGLFIVAIAIKLRGFGGLFAKARG